MLWKKLGSIKKLAKKVKATSNKLIVEPAPYECLPRDDEGGSWSASSPATRTPTGSFVVYVGEDRQRCVVPTSYLSHPLLKILLEKAYDESGFEQRNCLVVPCSVGAFQEVMSAVQCCNGRFEFGELVEEFL